MLDEPTSALDPTAAEEVLATLARLVHDLGLAVLVAEHRLERVVPFADRMVLLAGDGTLRVGAPGRRAGTTRRWCRRSSSSAGRPGWQPLPLSVREARRRARRPACRLRPAARATRGIGDQVRSGAGLSVAARPAGWRCARSTWRCAPAGSPR